jgi:hypothetical protein
MGGIEEVKKNIRNVYSDRLIPASYAVCLYFAGMALNYFRSVQPPVTGAKGRFWANKTAQAALRMFTDAFRDSNSIGWLMSHGVDYGVYLELANDRRHEAIRPIIQKYAGQFWESIQKLFKD